MSVNIETLELITLPSFVTLLLPSIFHPDRIPHRQPRPGLLMRMAAMLFEQLAEKARVVSASASYLEVYN